MIKYKLKTCTENICWKTQSANERNQRPKNYTDYCVHGL